jgi:hypothetical protein
MKYHLLSAVLILAAIVLEMAGYGKPGSNWAQLCSSPVLPANFGFGSALASPKRRGVTRFPTPKSNERPDNGRSLTAAWGRDAPASARVAAAASWEMRSVERLDGFDYGGATLVERVGDRIGILVPRAYSLPVLLPALHQRLGFGRYGRRHR